MGLIKNVDVSPTAGTAGAAHVEYIAAQLDPGIMKQIDCDNGDVSLAFDIYGAVDGLLKKSGTLTPIASIADDHVYAGSAAFTLAEAVAGAYVVKVRVTSDVDFGDDAEPEVVEAMGSEIDSDDIASFTRLFSLK